MVSPARAVPRGLADLPGGELGPAVVAAWDAFLELAAAADLEAPSRLPGWSGRDVLVHLGSWPETQPVAQLVAAARSGHPGPARDQDADNAALVAAHRSEPREAVLAALAESRERVAAYFADGLHDELGRRLAGSIAGQLPASTLVHAGTYELAVHALDLQPCGGAEVPPLLLLRGLAALSDVTGALCHRHGLAITVEARTPAGGWCFTSSAAGWTTEPLAPGRVQGIGIEGEPELLLDASAGRVNAVPLLVSRRMRIHRLPSFLRLAVLVEEVPTLPGGAALRAAVRYLRGAGRLLDRRLRP